MSNLFWSPDENNSGFEFIINTVWASALCVTCIYNYKTGKDSKMDMSKVYIDTIAGRAVDQL